MHWSPSLPVRMPQHQRSQSIIMRTAEGAQISQNTLQQQQHNTATAAAGVGGGGKCRGTGGRVTERGMVGPQEDTGEWKGSGSGVGGGEEGGTSSSSSSSSRRHNSRVRSSSGSSNSSSSPTHAPTQVHLPG